MKIVLTLLSFTLLACGSGEAPFEPNDVQEENTDTEAHTFIDEGDDLAPSNSRPEKVSVTIDRYSPPRGVTFSNASTDLAEGEFDLTIDGCRGSYAMSPMNPGGICLVEDEEAALALGADPSQCEWASFADLGSSTSVVVDRNGENYFLMDIVESEDGSSLTLSFQPLSRARCGFLIP